MVDGVRVRQGDEYTCATTLKLLLGLKKVLYGNDRHWPSCNSAGFDALFGKRRYTPPKAMLEHLMRNCNDALWYIHRLLHAALVAGKADGTYSIRIEGGRYTLSMGANSLSRQPVDSRTFESIWLHNATVDEHEQFCAAFAPFELKDVKKNEEQVRVNNIAGNIHPLVKLANVLVECRKHLMFLYTRSNITQDVPNARKFFTNKADALVGDAGVAADGSMCYNQSILTFYDHMQLFKKLFFDGGVCWGFLVIASRPPAHVRKDNAHVHFRGTPASLFQHFAKQFGWDRGTASGFCKDEVRRLQCYTGITNIVSFREWTMSAIPQVLNPLFHIFNEQAAVRDVYDTAKGLGIRFDPTFKVVVSGALNYMNWVDGKAFVAPASSHLFDAGETLTDAVCDISTTGFPLAKSMVEGQAELCGMLYLKTKLFLRCLRFYSNIVVMPCYTFGTVRDREERMVRETLYSDHFGDLPHAQLIRHTELLIDEPFSGPFEDAAVGVVRGADGEAEGEAEGEVEVAQAEVAQAGVMEEEVIQAEVVPLRRHTRGHAAAEAATEADEVIAPWTQTGQETPAAPGTPTYEPGTPTNEPETPTNEPGTPTNETEDQQAEEQPMEVELPEPPRGSKGKERAAAPPSDTPTSASAGGSALASAEASARRTSVSSPGTPGTPYTDTAELDLGGVDMGDGDSVVEAVREHFDTVMESISRDEQDEIGGVLSRASQKERDRILRVSVSAALNKMFKDRNLCEPDVPDEEMNDMSREYMRTIDVPSLFARAIQTESRLIQTEGITQWAVAFVATCVRALGYDNLFAATSKLGTQLRLFFARVGPLFKRKGGGASKTEKLLQANKRQLQRLFSKEMRKYGLDSATGKAFAKQIKVNGVLYEVADIVKDEWVAKFEEACASGNVRAAGSASQTNVQFTANDIGAMWGRGSTRSSVSEIKNITFGQRGDEAMQECFETLRIPLEAKDLDEYTNHCVMSVRTFYEALAERIEDEDCDQAYLMSDEEDPYSRPTSGSSTPRGKKRARSSGPADEYVWCRKRQAQLPVEEQTPHEVEEAHGQMGRFNCVTERGFRISAAPSRSESRVPSGAATPRPALRRRLG